MKIHTFLDAGGPWHHLGYRCPKEPFSGIPNPVAAPVLTFPGDTVPIIHHCTESLETSSLPFGMKLQRILVPCSQTRTLTKLTHIGQGLGTPNKKLFKYPIALKLLSA